MRRCTPTCGRTIVPVSAWDPIRFQRTTSIGPSESLTPFKAGCEASRLEIFDWHVSAISRIATAEFLSLSESSVGADPLASVECYTSPDQAQDFVVVHRYPSLPPSAGGSVTLHCYAALSPHRLPGTTFPTARGGKCPAELPASTAYLPCLATRVRELHRESISTSEYSRRSLHPNRERSGWFGAAATLSTTNARNRTRSFTFIGT